MRDHPRISDALLAFAIAALALAALLFGPRARPDAPTRLDVIEIVLTFGLLLVRRVWPLVVLGLAVTAAVILFVVASGINLLGGTVIIAVATVAAETDRRTAWIAGTATAAVLFTAGVLTSAASWLAPEYVGLVAWTAMGAAVGDAIRSRRAYIAAIEERARRAEQSREEEARRQVIEERLHIAHELHDVLAHNIAVINVQAAVATHVLRDQPERAEEALRHVRRASQAVLDELSALLNVLRESGPAPDEPAPGLDRLPQLLDTFGAAGLRISPAVTGSARPLPAAVDLAAYRVVQEALTNVHKHGGGAGARLRLEYTPDRLRIEVVNVGGSAHGGWAQGGSGHGPQQGTGHGIVGMRERAMSVGGWAQAGSVGDGPFRLVASLPVPAPGTDEDAVDRGGM